MKVDKISISFPAKLGDEARQAARNAGHSLSSWLADAAAAKLRSETLRALLDDWGREDGPLTPEEISRAEVELGFRTNKLSG
jgi:hypothetical protein